jgi:hypothetical protein
MCTYQGDCIAECLHPRGQCGFDISEAESGCWYRPTTQKHGGVFLDLVFHFFPVGHVLAIAGRPCIVGCRDLESATLSITHRIFGIVAQFGVAGLCVSFLVYGAI